MFRLEITKKSVKPVVLLSVVEGAKRRWSIISATL